LKRSTAPSPRHSCVSETNLSGTWT